MKIQSQKDSHLNKKLRILNKSLGQFDSIYMNSSLLFNKITATSPEMSKRNRPQDISKELEEFVKQEKEQIKDKSHEGSKNQQQSQSLSKLLPSKVTNFTGYKLKKQNDLPQQFFRQQVVDLAKALLGKIFVRKTPKGLIKAVIVQTQAYKAPQDKACHAYKNKKTERTKYFWLDGGHLYIYTIYMPTNICLNVVAGNEQQPEAVLIRAVEPIQGINIIKQFRNIKSPKIEDLCNGPGKVGKSLGINMKEMNGSKLFEGDFKIIDGGISGFSMGTSRRVNIDYAEEWIDKPWRFFIEGNKFVSKVDVSEQGKKKKGKE